MKNLKYIFIYSLMMVFAYSCEKGLDPITSVAPGPDENTPVLTINYPTEGKVIRLDEEVGTITFELVASDDIELQSVVVQLDGVEIGRYTSFKDYRRAAIDLVYTQLVDGNHTLTSTVTDLTGKSATASVNFKKVTISVYVPLVGEVFYMPFEDEFLDVISETSATVVGTPDFTEGIQGTAYIGATGSYLTFPTTELIKTKNITAAFWMKVNADPTRAGILTMSPEDLENPGYPNIQNLRTSGFRFFREGGAASQQFKLNVGLGGTDESWNDGGNTDPTTGEWVHFAYTVSDTASAIYINGEMVRESKMLKPIDWTGCDVLTIMSGFPRFTGWDHFSDLSLLDELHIFNRVLTIEEIQALGTIE
ncbi:MAG: LamG-like jellyroll fold domain-containing protein [Lentimicrobium sp.]